MITVVEKIAAEAGALALQKQRERLDVEHKGDGTPVTHVDLLCHDLIAAGLSKAFPDIPIVSEEDPDSHQLDTLQNPRYWLVDPLDGTRSYIKGTPEFTVNIALIEDGLPTLGVINCPGEALTMGATKDSGLSVNGQPFTPPSITPKDQATYTISGSVTCFKRLHTQFPEMSNDNTMKAGSAWKFCLLALRKALIYPKLGPTMEWDTAAGQLILELSQGSVQTLDGKPLAYGKKNFANPHFIARAFSSAQ